MRLFDWLDIKTCIRGQKSQTGKRYNSFLNYILLITGHIGIVTTEYVTPEFTVAWELFFTACQSSRDQKNVVPFAQPIIASCTVTRENIYDLYNNLLLYNNL